MVQTHKAQPAPKKAAGRPAAGQTVQGGGGYAVIISDTPTWSEELRKVVSGITGITGWTAIRSLGVEAGEERRVIGRAEGPSMTILGSALDDAIQKIVDQRLEAALAKQAPASAFPLPENHRPGIENAMKRGAQSRAEVLRQPAMSNSDQLAKALNVTRETINRRRKAGELLALSDPVKRGFKYPLWQFEDGIREVLPEVLKLFGNLDPWVVYSFLTSSNPMLGAHTPLEALRQGRGADVARVAADYVDELA